jgi:uncharacterized surface protein with fasciclin (FAS1) repeats
MPHTFEQVILIDMKKIILFLSTSTLVFSLCSCSGTNDNEQSKNVVTEEQIATGQSGVEDNESQKDVVKVAVSSPDHTTLVKALQAAELVDALSNAGPFTVFAPLNKAFDELPAGTVESLLKPESKSKLQDVLQHHVYVGALKVEQLNDGQVLGMVDGNNVTIHKKDGKVFVNESEILGSVVASNGIVHVVDKVILAN